ncbi:uncharacterized protein TNCV_3676371 [Trichonephila clavipes]|nr:uncharacterized protein TNCV_3676371 [Trichonephila clavipes]
MAANNRTISSGSTLVYCYRCTIVSFVNSSTSAAPWISCKGAFIQDPPHGKRSTAAYVCEVLQPEIVPFLQGIPEAIFQQDNAHPHVANTVRDFFLAQHMQLLPWPAYSPDMLPINPPIGQHGFFHPTREASKTDHTEFFLRPGIHQK